MDKKTRRVRLKAWDPRGGQSYRAWQLDHVGQLCPDLDDEEKDRLMPAGYHLVPLVRLSDATRRKLKADGWQWSRAHRLWVNPTIEWV
jgi:hypothetical protein